MKRRDFVRFSAATGATLVASPSLLFAGNTNAKATFALVGTGIRGIGFWGTELLKNFSNQLELVALCDINPGRLAFAKKKLGVDCKTFSDFELLLKEVKPDYMIVTTVDAEHDQQIIRALESGIDVITEKPMTTDEVKCKKILEAEKKSGKKLWVAFNYRHSVHSMKLKELLTQKKIGEITSVDFHWYLNVYHGADYFRRWHAYTSRSGSLWVHKATHHFDLLNWWLNSEPVEVSAFGAQEFYGKNGKLRGKTCRTCNHKKECAFYWDITKNQQMMDLYVANEHHDGYLRDGCVFREDIDIPDKMSAQIQYANGVTVNYSLTTYSPYEGWKIAFNGKNGRMETWEDIPYMDKITTDQANRHAAEMEQTDDLIPGEFREILVMENFKKDINVYTTPRIRGGHGGGDIRMQKRMFMNKNDNPFNVMAGSREGAMSILIGIAARKSMALQRPVKISELTDLIPQKTVHPQ